MSERFERTLLRSGVVSSSLVLVSWAWTDLARAAEEAASPQLEEVVVTAQKRSENLQQVPIAVTALNAAALEDRGINDIHTMSGLTPNVTLDQASPFSGSNQVLSASIRGIGQDDFAMNLDPGVGVYVDGVYLARTIGANQNLMDVDRVEVLRGPQGTLFGRNTIGGAISVVTRTPSSEYNAKAQVTVGSFDRRDISATADIPISGNLLTSLTFSSLEREGYQKHVRDPNAGNYVIENFDNYISSGFGPSNSLGGQGEQTLRGKALWIASDSVKVTVAADWTHSDTSSTPSTVLRIFDTQANGGGSLEGLYNACISFTPATAPPPLQVLCGPMGPKTTPIPGGFITSGPSLLTGPRQPYTLAATQTGNIDTTYASGNNFDRLTSYGAAVTVDWDLNSNTQLRSISGYRQLRWKSATDLDGSETNILQAAFDSGQHQASEELQAVGAAFGDKLHYVGGLYYFNEKGFIHDYPIIGSGLLQIDGNNTLNTSSYAVFFHADYKVTDALGLTAGGRFSREHKEFEGFQHDDDALNYKASGFYPVTPANQAILGFPVAGDPLRYFPAGVNKRDFNIFTPTLGVQYHLTSDLMGYGSWSKGFKSGGWTTRLSNPIPSAKDAEFGPEKAQTYEVGVKSEWLERRLIINLAGFYTDYKDIQLNFQQGISPTLKNAGDAKIIGGEFEGHALLGHGFALNTTVGAMHAYYTRLALGTGLDSTNTNPTALPLGTKLPKTPTLKVNISPEYEIQISSASSLRFLADWTHTSSLFNDSYNTPELKRPAVDMVGASIQFTHEKVTLVVGGTNLTDKRYITTGQNQQGGGLIYGTYNEPREWYATARIKF